MAIQSAGLTLIRYTHASDQYAPFHTKVVELWARLRAEGRDTVFEQEWEGYQASNAAKLSSYDRRQYDWNNQSNAALGEMSQIFKQWRGAQIRQAIAEQEYNNYLQQIQQSKDVERSSKVSN